MSWAVYQKYKSHFQLPDHEWLEHFVRAESLYDVLEFSIKFRRNDNRFSENPQRYSIWKYNFHPDEGAAFLNEGFRCFEECTKDTNAAAKFDEFRKKSLNFKEEELRYFSFGTEIDSDPTKTRLKTYTGYRSRLEPNFPFIVREELNLNGTFKSSKYDGYPTRDPSIQMLFPDLYRFFETAPFFYCAYAERGRLHLKSQPDASELALGSVSHLINDDRAALSTAFKLLAEGFLVEVVTMRRSELIAKDLQNITIYFRYGDPIDREV